MVFACKGSKTVLSNNVLDTDRPKPNVVLILTDDLGWQDVKCYDIDEPSPYETPNIDALSKKGVMFWQAYSPAPTCAPSRCAIMSGNHPARAQKTHVVGGHPPLPYLKDTFRMMDPWYSGRMPENEMTLARAMQNNGYTTGHAGKWHMAVDHKAYPQPEDQGFDYTRSDRGVTKPQKPNRLTDFATDEASDPFRLDENGYPYHQNNEDALNFLRQNKQDPFFLYYATWLVHAPIHTRSKALLEKYCEKLGVDYPTDPGNWPLDGQRNPYYISMVDMMDYYVGQIFNYLETTDDPRWPGHKLVENTYIIFTSDNGGMEGKAEIFTDNYPLDRGKISAMEGGTRVPLIITGPGIEKGVQSDVMVNGLDFYPTILSLTDSKQPKDKSFDGSDISELLLKDPTDPNLVKSQDGDTRTTMMWHFPHGIALESTIRIGDYKLIRNYDSINNPNTESLELYRLYNSEGKKVERVDIEESKNLVNELPEKTKQLNNKLTEMLTEIKASYPYYNSEYNGKLPHKESVPTVLSHENNQSEVTFSFEEHGAKVIKANLIYTSNGGERFEEWFQTPAEVMNTKVKVTLPKGTTHYVINLIDENNYLVSYPLMGQKKRGKKQFYTNALKN
ncbi:N-acetylgalactosamine 6-sulfatase [Flagellimonas eckloniae]|uniref:N-acetylgalactosamine 6-sulfatase n=1 Tax=Flagellimonas eckloniae TaxID=346185 RepID=A0A0Q0XQU3_9FLAO|nr:N-acetylgalactosamine 6-sulfatase [Allomuricauda eckloniae]